MADNVVNYQVGKVNNCNPVFARTIELSCVISLLTSFRTGLSVAAVQQGLWLTGSALNQFLPPPDDVSLTEEKDLDEILDELEQAVAQIQAHQELVNTAPSKEDVAKAMEAEKKDWTIVLPILLQLLTYLIEFLRKPKA